MKKRVRIALAQIKYFDVNRKHNLQKIKEYIKKAKLKGADIICFPETCVHKTERLHLRHKLLKEIQEECRKNSIWCIITEEINFKDKVYNTSILIDREGEIKGKYKKIHLFGDKTSAGRNVKVFTTDFAKISIAICWDLAFPKMFKKMKQRGAQIVFCPSKWWYETKAHEKNHKENEINLLESLVVARAFENLFFVAVCNPVSESKFQVSYTAIADPHKILSKIVDKEGMITADINLREIKKLERVYS